jgi:hypothetical protein
MNRRIYDIEAKKTTYKGITFRSKLEVVWAMFFDNLGWDWQYEPTFFKLPSGNYLPDFYFPDIHVYAEAKPNDFVYLERLKCIQLSELLVEVPILQLIGEPQPNPIKSILNGGNGHNLIPVPLTHKFYPFFLSDEFSFIDHYDTSVAISQSYFN